MFEKLVEVIVIAMLLGILGAGIYVAFDSRYEMIEKQRYFDDVNNNKDIDKIA